MIGGDGGLIAGLELTAKRRGSVECRAEGLRAGARRAEVETGAIDMAVDEAVLAKIFHDEVAAIVRALARSAVA